jgi:hypothetical protein
VSLKEVMEVGKIAQVEYLSCINGTERHLPVTSVLEMKRTLEL